MAEGVLSGRIVLVTGGSQGIGRAIAERFAAEGAKVAIGYSADADAARGVGNASQDVVAGIKEAGGEAVAIDADMGDEEDVKRLARRVTAVYGRIDVLVNNAGIGIPHRPFQEVPLEDWERIVAVNLTGPFLLCQAVLPGMLARNRGKIINFSSELALIGRAQSAPYVVTKAGIIGLTKSLAREVGPKGIQVNAIAPGPTDTGLLGPLDRAPESIEQLPLRRLGRPEEIANTALFLASPAGDWYTGQVLSPNGGAVI